MLYRVEVVRVLYVEADDEHEAEIALKYVGKNDAECTVTVNPADLKTAAADGWLDSPPYGATIEDMTIRELYKNGDFPIF